MLRVSPDGKDVWVQTGQANTNVVLDADSMAVLQTTSAGKQPVEAAFQPSELRSLATRAGLANPTTRLYRPAFRIALAAGRLL